MSHAIPAPRELTSAEVAELLEASPALDREVTSRLLVVDAYQLDQGQSLLVFRNGKGLLYESRTGMLETFRAIENEPPGPSLAELLPQGRQFPGQAGRLAAALGITGLGGLDDVARRLGPDECLRDPVFGQLVAYVGETIRAELGGGWQMRLAADGSTWEPWLIDAAGREHAPFILVLKELTEWDPARSSLAGVVSGHLSVFRT